MESVVAQLGFDDFGDDFPLTSCQAGSHSGHVNRGVVRKGKISDSDQSFANGVVPNWRSSLVSFGDAGLANDVGYAYTCLNLYELNIAKSKRKAPVACGPLTVGAFWLGPTVGECFDEASVPETSIVTAMGDDSITRSERFGCVALDVIEWHSLSLLTIENQVVRSA
jgi:hypothetical protein